VAHLPANVKSSHHYFIEEELREELLKRNEALLNPIGLVGEKQSFSSFQPTIKLLTKISFFTCLLG